MCPEVQQMSMNPPIPVLLNTDVTFAARLHPCPVQTYLVVFPGIARV